MCGTMHYREFLDHAHKGTIPDLGDHPVCPEDAGIILLFGNKIYSFQSAFSGKDVEGYIFYDYFFGKNLSKGVYTYIRLLGKKGIVAENLSSWVRFSRKFNY